MLGKCSGWLCLSSVWNVCVSILLELLLMNICLGLMW